MSVWIGHCADLRVIAVDCGLKWSVLYEIGRSERLKIPS
jgi:hypothetical protein